MAEKSKLMLTGNALLGLAFVTLTVIGCEYGARPPDISSIGPPPSPGFDPEPILRAKLETFFIDAESARFKRVGGPVPGRARQPLMLGGAVAEGWGYCYLVNAKNKLGGYTGYQSYYFVFRNEQPVGGAENRELSSWNCF